MFRYRCPHCRQVLQALEIRAGKTTICSKCSRPLTIPANRAEWLNERGEPLAGSPTVSLAAGPPARSGSDEDAGDDVLGAIFVGSDVAPSGVTAKEQLPPFPAARAAEPAADAPNGPHGPQTRRIPFPMPDSPRASAWLIPPSRAEDARTPVPPAPAPEPAPPAPAPPAEAAGKPDTTKIRRSVPPPEPPEPPEPVPELVSESPPADQPAVAKAAEPPAGTRPEQTLVAPAAKPPEPAKVSPREPPRRGRPSRPSSPDRTRRSSPRRRPRRPRSPRPPHRRTKHSSPPR